MYIVPEDLGTDKQSLSLSLYIYIYIYRERDII